MNPQTDSIVSRSSEERTLQAQQDKDHWSIFPDDINPLCTPTILAIQGISRIERQNALGHGMESKEFQRGQVSINCFIVLQFRYQLNETLHALPCKVSLYRVSSSDILICSIQDFQFSLDCDFYNQL